MNNKIRKATDIALRDIISSDSREIVPEMRMVKKKIVTTQRIVLLRSFFAADGSGLDTDQFPFEEFFKKTVAGRINLTA